VSNDNLACELAAFVTGLAWDELPEHARDSARDRTLDAISTAIASRSTRATSSALGTLEALGHRSGPCTVLPSGTRAGIDGAAFANGVAVHAILFEDINLSSSDHPGAVIVPAALAAAEAAASVTGTPATVEDLLLAVLAGYETHLWLGVIAAPGVIARGLRTTSVFGSVGAAAAVAKALRLPPGQTTTAIALGANTACGFLEGFQHGTMEPYLQAGFAARNGVLAALLARSGAAAAGPAFEGGSGYLRGFADISGYRAGAGHPDWLIGGVSAKPYPISGGKIAAVDSALAVQQQGFDGATIDGVRIVVPTPIKDFPGGDRRGPFETMYQAQDSTQYCVAAALLGRPIWSLRTVMDDFADPEVSDLTHRTELIGEDDRTLSAVSVTLSDGRTLSAEVDWSDRQVPTVAAMSAKLADLTEGYWPEGQAARVSDVVTGSPQAPITALSELLGA
jgi:2-methylcitrate dehydratase PrpD